MTTCCPARTCVASWSTSTEHVRRRAGRCFSGPPVARGRRLGRCRPVPRGRAARRGARLRRPRPARGAARHRQDDPAAGCRGGQRGAVRVRRGQRRADPGPAGRALRPGAGARSRLPRGRLRRRAARPGAARRRPALRRGGQSRPRGDAERAADRHERGRAARAPAGPGAGRRRLPAGRGDEPVRCGRHRPDLLRRVRPGLPDHDGLPERAGRGADRGAAGASGRRGLARAGRGPGTPDPRPSRRTDRLVGARHHRHGADGGVARRAARAVIPLVADRSGCRAGGAVRPDPAAGVVRPAARGRGARAVRGGVRPRAGRRRHP